MNIIKLKVNFEKRTIIKEGIILTENDYNSTKIQFEFDKDGRKVFEMNNPNGNLIYANTIENNELILVGEDGEHNPCSLFSQPGKYPFEISLYDGESKLTSASDDLYVAPEMVKIGDEVAEVYLPVFDEMNATLASLINQTDNLSINASKTNNVTTIVITKKDGTTQEVEILDGEKGADGKDATINGVNTLTIEAGDNITLEQEGSTLTINSTGGGGGTGDYNDLSNKPKINNVELSGNKTTSDLGISYNDLTNKPDLSQYITKTVDDLINYYKKSETYTQAEINALIGAISTLNLLVVQTLPTEDISTTTIYLVPKTTSETNNIYDEYIYVSNAWEKIGSTEVDLSNYYTKTEADALLDDKQDTLTAGNNINISSENVISATGIVPEYWIDLQNAEQTISAVAQNIIDQVLEKGVNGLRIYAYNSGIGFASNKKAIYISSLIQVQTTRIIIDFGLLNGVGIDGEAKYGYTYTKSSTAQITINFDSTTHIYTTQSTSMTPRYSLLDAPTFLTPSNTTSYSVSNNYTPAHKKYVDDSISNIDGVKDANTTNKDKFWSGTLSQYNAIQNKDADTFYYITDDYESNGVPSGGTTGQVLAKASGTDFDTEWVSQHSFSHETWTFTLEDDTTVDKEVVLW